MYICMYMCSARYVSLNVDGKQFASQKGINKSRWDSVQVREVDFQAL